MKRVRIGFADSRLRKVWSDARTASGRFIVMGVAMAFSLTAIVAILSARAVLQRELQRNYTDTRPASATLQLDSIDEDLLAQFKARPAIAAAARRALMGARVWSGREWLGITLFVVPDFTRQSVSKFYSESGEWPPATGSVLIERSGLSLMRIVIGASLQLEMPDGKRHVLRIGGQVHDPGQAPSWQEIHLYGYITTQTLAQVAPDRTLDSLEILVTAEHDTIERIDTVARELATWLKGQRRAVYEIQIPQPNAHPHQWQVDIVLALLLGFSLLGLALEAVLLAIVVAGMLAPQTRQIGVMKTIGAGTRQIAVMYIGMVGAIAVITVLVAVPLGAMTGDALARYIANLLNFEVANRDVPWATLGIGALLGLAVPLAASFAPVWIAARRSVRASIDDFGVATNVAQSPLVRALSRLPLATGWQLAFRNSMRRKSRFALSLTLLFLAGLVFILAGNLRATWTGVGNEAKANRIVDLQVIFRRAVPASRAVGVVQAVAGVARVEPTNSAVAYIDRGDGLAVSRADQRNLLLRSVAPASQLFSLPVTEGRWLDASDQNAVVLNSMARAKSYPRAQLGDLLPLTVNRKHVQVRLVGVIRETFGDTAGYTSADVLEHALGATDSTRQLIIDVSPDYRTADVEKEVAAALRRADLEPRWINDVAAVDRAVDGHTYMLIAVLGLIVSSVAFVGILGLASALGTSVIERTRELGVLRTLGARAADVRATVIGEAMLVAFVSWLLASVAAVPATIGMMKIIASISPIPLPLAWSSTAFARWLALVLIAAIAAALWPASRAARLTIRQALSYN